MTRNRQRRRGEADWVGVFLLLSVAVFMIVAGAGLILRRPSPYAHRSSEFVRALEELCGRNDVELVVPAETLLLKSGDRRPSFRVVLETLPQPAESEGELK